MNSPDPAPTPSAAESKKDRPRARGPWWHITTSATVSSPVPIAWFSMQMHHRYEFQPVLIQDAIDEAIWETLDSIFANARLNLGPALRGLKHLLNADVNFK